MKVITTGTIPPTPPDWRILVINTCENCGAQWQFEDAGSEELPPFYIFTGQLPVGRFRNSSCRDDANEWIEGIESSCPTCGDLVFTPAPDSATYVERGACAMEDA